MTAGTQKMSTHIRDLILFDGVCGLCNHFVQLVLDHDRDGRYCFASLQSELGQAILQRLGQRTQELKTIYLIEDIGENQLSADALGSLESFQSGRVYRKSDAALRIIKHLEGLGPLSAAAAVSAFMPRPLRDFGYDLVASNRYLIFGKLDACRLPSPEECARFLDL
jgi:predicted DCC family thiol-disulfide oxidoreductase YuxK